MTTALQVEWPIFESLFVHAFQPTGDFAAELRKAGLDLARPQPRYPAPVLDASLEIAARHVYPFLSHEQAHRELGLKAGEMFFKTLLGTVMGATMPLIGPDRVMASMPRRMKTSSNGECSVEKRGERSWRMTMEGTSLPAFIAGTMVAALRRCKVAPTVKLEKTTAGQSVFAVTW